MVYISPFLFSLDNIGNYIRFFGSIAEESRKSFINETFS